MEPRQPLANPSLTRGPPKSTCGCPRLWPMLAVACALPLLIACYARTTLTQAPANHLMLDISFAHALAPTPQGGVPTPQVTVSVVITTMDGGHAVVFGGHQTLTCDGVPIPEDDLSGVGNPPIRVITLPRQPPGGHYIFVYTDEGGRQTTLVVPAPAVDLAIVAPSAGASVPIPQRTSAGQPTATTATTAPTPGGPRTPDEVDPPVLVRYTVPFPASSLVRASGAAIRDDVTASARGACLTYADPYCVTVTNGPLAADGTAGITDAGTFYGRGFDDLAPGPGALNLAMAVTWDPPAVGFAAVRVEFADEVSVPVTWVAA